MTSYKDHPEVKKKRSFGMMHIIELGPYGVIPDSVTGGFAKETIPLEVVKNHPDLHVISACSVNNSAVYLNRYEPNARVYYIGNGCADPLLEARPPKVPADEVAALFRRSAEREQAEKPMSAEERAAQAKYFDNIAYGRPPYEGIMTREEVTEHRAASAAAVRRNRGKKKAFS